MLLCKDGKFKHKILSLNLYINNVFFSPNLKDFTSHLADTITASRSLHLSAGIDFRHCLDRRKRPGKNTEPAARMVSMIPVELSERREVQWAIWRSVALPPSLKNKKHQLLRQRLVLIRVVSTPMSMHLAARLR